MLFELARDLNRAGDEATRRQIAGRLRASGRVMGLLGASPSAWFTGAGAGLPAAEIERRLAEREAARARRDFAEADRIRDELAGQGIAVEDSAEGPRWRRSD